MDFDIDKQKKNAKLRIRTLLSCAKSARTAGSTRSVWCMCECCLLLLLLGWQFTPQVHEDSVTFRHLINSVKTDTLLTVSLIAEVAALARGGGGGAWWCGFHDVVHC